MATITLRAYIDELESLIQQEALEEVIGHCRHILQYFPKNLDAYRLLGKALLEKLRYDESQQIFQRLLSADPNDFVTHVGLSTIFEYHNDLGRALWHMERAFEQKPNNKVIGDEIRRLVRALGKEPPRKIKMTRGALAKQYVNNGMYDQALSELRQALADNKQRIDIKLLLANTLWQAGYPVEAGESALEILQVMPDALAANKLMARLWLASGRPEDAQAFLKRVEDLAPYESLQLIYDETKDGETVPDAAFTIQRLDWTTAAATGLGGASADWVNKIGNVFEIADDISLSGSTDTEDVVGADEDDEKTNLVSPFADEEIPDWVSGGTGPLGSKDSAGTMANDDLPDWFAEGADFGGKPQTGELSAPEDWFDEMSNQVNDTGSLDPSVADDAQQARAFPSGSGFTGMLNEMEDEEADEEIDSLRDAARPPSPEEVAALLASARGEEEETETPDWMGGTSDEPDWGDDGIEIDADDDIPDWFTSEDSPAGDASDDVDLFFDIEDDLPAPDFSSELDELEGASEEADDELASIFEDESSGVDTSWLTQSSEDDELPSEEDEEFAALFSDGDDLGVDTAFLQETGFEEPPEEAPSESVETPDFMQESISDNELESLFEEDEAEGLDTSWLAESNEAADDAPAEDEEFSSLFGDEVAADTSFLNATGFDAGDSDEEEDQFEFAAMDSADDTRFDGEDELAGLFNEDNQSDDGEFEFAAMDSVDDAGFDEADDDLAGLFEDEAEGLDTSWLAESNETADDSVGDDELDSLFGDEVAADTSFLNATGFDAGDSDEEEDQFEFAAMDSADDASSEETEDDLAGLFEDEAEGVDTSWLAESSETVDDGVADDELDSLFGDEVAADTSFLNATGFDAGDSDEEENRFEFAAMDSADNASSEETEDDLAGLFEDEAEGLDTSWLAESSETVDDSMPDDELDALFGDELAADTAFMSDTGFDDVMPDDEDSQLFAVASTDDASVIEDAEDDLASIFSDEPVEAIDTTWLQEQQASASANAGDADEFDSMFGDDSGDMDEEEDFESMFADEIGVNTGFLQEVDADAAEQTESVDDLQFDDAQEASEEEFDAFASEEEPSLDTSWLSQSVVDEYEDEQQETVEDDDLSALFDETDGAATGFLTNQLGEPGTGMFGEDTEAEEATSDDWLGDVESTGSLTTEAVDNVDSILDGEAEVSADDDLQSLFSEEDDVTVDTGFLQAVDAAEDIATSEEDLDALFAEEGGNTDFLTASEPEEEESLDLDSLFGGSGDSQPVASVSQPEPQAEAPQQVADDDIDSLFDELDTEKAVETGPLIDDFLASDEPNIEDDDEDLSDIFAAVDVDEAVEESEDEIEALFADSFDDMDEDEDDVLFSSTQIDELASDDNIADLFADDAFAEEAPENEELEDEFADLLEGDIEPVTDVDDEELDAIFGGLDLEDDVDFVSEAQAVDNEPAIDDVFDEQILDDPFLTEEAPEEQGVDEFAGTPVNTFDNELSDDDMDDLFADEAFAEVETEPEDELSLDDFEDFAADEELEVDDDFATELESEFADLLEEEVDDSGSEAVSEDEFASVFGSETLQSDDEANEDDMLFDAITSGEDTTNLIEDAELAADVKWVSDIEDEELDSETVATSEPAGLPENVGSLPDVPQIRFTAFNRQPRWMKNLGGDNTATTEEDLDEEALFDDLLNSEFDDLLDDEDETDWLE